MDLRDAAAYHLLTLEAEHASEQTQRHYLFFWQKLIEGMESLRVPLDPMSLTTNNMRQILIWYREHVNHSASRGGEVGVKLMAMRCKTFSKFLAREQIIPDDLLRTLKPPRVTKVMRQPFTQSEVAAMWGACRMTSQPEREEALFLLLLDTGMRIGEAATLTLDRLNLDERRVIVGAQGKGRRERLVPIGDPTKRDGGRVLRALRNYLAVRAPRLPDTGRLFISREGRALSASAASEAVQRLGELAGVPNPIPHRLRHAQPLYSPVLTPDGWRTMGDLVVGDEVIGADGKPTRVVGVYPQGMQDIVRLRFSDGASAECTLDHLWTVRPSLSQVWPREADHWRTMPTHELLEGVGPWHTPVSAPVEFSHRDTLPIDPYTLGALLGDGHMTYKTVAVATAVDEREVIDRIESVLPAGLMVGGQPGNYRLVASRHSAKPLGRALSSTATGLRRTELNTDEIVANYSEGQTTVEIATRLTTTHRTIIRHLRRAGVSLRKPGQPSNPLFNALAGLGLMESRSFNKAIPSCYLAASIDDRRELLRGLMDTDGTVNKTGAAMFTTISPQLAAGVVELVRSLGGIATLTVRSPYTTSKHLAYRIGIRTPFTPFHMARKCERYELANGAVRTTKPGRASRYELVRTIKSIEPAGATECVCIQVANEDGLYVTKDYVVTHNTYATFFLVTFPGDEIGLRQILGHLSHDVLADYVHFSQAVIAQRSGRASLAESWLGGGTTRAPLPTRIAARATAGPSAANETTQLAAVRQPSREARADIDHTSTVPGYFNAEPRRYSPPDWIKAQ